jgi:hypothetical protein
MGQGAVAKCKLIIMYVPVVTRDMESSVESSQCQRQQRFPAESEFMRLAVGLSKWTLLAETPANQRGGLAARVGLWDLIVLSGFLLHFRAMRETHLLPAHY